MNENVCLCHYESALTTSLLLSVWLIISISIRSAARKLTEGNDASSRPLLPKRLFLSMRRRRKHASSLEEHQLLHAMHLLPYNLKIVCIDHKNMVDYDLLVKDSSIWLHDAVLRCTWANVCKGQAKRANANLEILWCVGVRPIRAY